MHNEQLRCKTLVCPKAARAGRPNNWCCHGCDDADCIDRCTNGRNRCNVAIYDECPEIRRNGCVWSEQEIALLVANYRGLTGNELMALIPGRTLSAIRRKADHLGVATPRSKRENEEELR